MQCPKCKADLPPRAKFCNECGADVTAASAESGVEQSVGEARTRGADLSLGEARTLGADAKTPEVSVGAAPTMAPAAGGQDTAPSARRGMSVTDRYEILGKIGEGGFASVWRARDRELDRTVAIKRLLPGKLTERESRQTLERFRREAQAVASLNHRNIAAVYDRGEDSDGPYIVMEMVEDGSLKALLKERGKLPAAEAVRIVRGIAQGLDHAHRKGIVHRDIKPANVLLRREGDELVPKIVDFGLARAGGDTGVSLTGYGMGTLSYMPPEQRRDAKSVNHTADIYALGKVFYEALTGERPDDVDLDKLPAEFAPIVKRCTKPNPAERYFSVAEMLAELDSGGMGAAPRKAKAGGVNACPACGADNAEDAEFCEGCGGGLFRECPECGTRNHLSKPFCRKCGTSPECMRRVAEAADRCRRHMEEKQYSRVVKEADGIADAAAGLKGEKGHGLLTEVEGLRKEAVRLAASRDATVQAVKAAHEARDGAALRKALETLGTLTGPLDGELAQMAGDLPGIERENRVAQLRERFAEAMSAENIGEAEKAVQKENDHHARLPRVRTGTDRTGVRRGVSDRL
jgi:serine/threonine protein kinase